MPLTDIYVTVYDLDENPDYLEAKSVFRVVDPEDYAEWVKNIAEWWSQGYTSDAEFIRAIQFLVDEGIITIYGIDPSIPIPISITESSETVDEIPEWIKQIAEWWAAGLVDDDSFYDMIEYLVNTGVIVLE